MDLVVNYGEEEFIVELKFWRGTKCLNVKKVDTFGSNTESENEEKDENY